jgi:hypothetical protein
VTRLSVLQSTASGIRSLTWPRRRNRLLAVSQFEGARTVWSNTVSSLFLLFAISEVDYFWALGIKRYTLGMIDR